MTGPEEEDLIGKWSVGKLGLLRRYLAAYLKILTNQPWCRGYEYIDAFAGTGKPKSRDEHRYVDGSPRIALSLRPSFTQYHFVEQESWRVARLEKLRAFISQKTSLQQVIDFGDAPVFTAISYPCIVILTRQPPNGNQSRVMTWQPGPPIEEFASVFQTNGFSMSQKELNSDGWRLESPAGLRLLEKLRKAGKPLSDYVKGRFYRGVTTGLNEAFVVDRATRDCLIKNDKTSVQILKPFLRGRDVKRRRIEPQDLWLIFTRRGVDIKKYPAIYDYLKTYKEQLTPGIPGGRKPGTYKWYEIQDNTEYWKEFETKKVIYPDISETPQFSYDNEGYYLGNTLYLIPTDNQYILSLLNSKVVFWFYLQTSPKIRGGFVRFIWQYVSEIPVPPAQADQETPLKALVNQILVAKKADPTADVAALEAEIDQLVYSLYDLTHEEIAIIEESLQEKTVAREVVDDSALEESQ